MKISNQKLTTIVRQVLKEVDTLDIKDMNSEVESESDFSDEGPIIGSSWKSCSVWNRIGKSQHGNKFNFVKSPSLLRISYIGPSYGLLIAHSQGGKDTMHQFFNVLICEFNPYLALIKAKPLIHDVTYNTWTEKKQNIINYGLSVTIPLEKSTKSYQLERRGGWGHTASSGKTKMKSKCENTKNCQGPLTFKFTGNFGTITEYFITFPL
ncbi:hypothetical protein EBU91_03545 [bacterium]|nr:hypothetical protein [bacterium]